MSVWAYRCRSCDEDPAEWFVSQMNVEQLPADVQIVRVRVGSQWRCAVVDRSRRVDVEAMLVREVIASDAIDCPQCAELAAHVAGDADRDQPASLADPEPAEEPISAGSSAPFHASRRPAVTVQAAAISLQGQNFAVVLVPMHLVRSAGEADMAIDDLQPRFGGVPVVLMAQKDDGTPTYYGDSQLVEMLADIPIDKMPWKEYPVG